MNALVLADFPPLHPIFVNFTAALIPTSFLFDLLSLFRKSQSLRAVGWWTLLLAGVLTPLTVAFGWFWMKSMSDMDHWQMPYHQWLGTIMGGGLIVLVIWRGVMQYKGQFPGLIYGLVAAVVLVGLLIQGDLGGSMTFEQGIVFSSSAGHEEHETTPAPATAPATQHVGEKAATQASHHPANHGD